MLLFIWIASLAWVSKQQCQYLFQQQGQEVWQVQKSTVWGCADSFCLQQCQPQVFGGPTPWAILWGNQALKDKSRKRHVILRKESCEWVQLHFKQKCKQHLLETVLLSNLLNTLLSVFEVCETNTPVRKTTAIYFKTQARFSATESFFSSELGSIIFICFSHICSVIH